MNVVDNRSVVVLEPETYAIDRAESGQGNVRPHVAILVVTSRMGAIR